jgi:hypothetical protein
MLLKVAVLVSPILSICLLDREGCLSRLDTHNYRRSTICLVGVSVVGCILQYETPKLSTIRAACGRKTATIQILRGDVLFA